MPKILSLVLLKINFIYQLLYTNENVALTNILVFNDGGISDISKIVFFSIEMKIKSKSTLYFDFCFVSKLISS